MGDTVAVDAMAVALQDPFNNYHMGVTAENIADNWSINREDQDALAVESHRRAAHAIGSGYFEEQILPVEIKSRKGSTLFDRDEHVREDVTVEQLAKLRTVFKEDGSVTAGTAPGAATLASPCASAAGRASRQSSKGRISTLPGLTSRRHPVRFVVRYGYRWFGDCIW
jgi:acetyl-CoA C-acetyltransferase